MGTKNPPPPLQRAAGWCKAVRKEFSLAPEQPAERHRPLGPAGLPPVIKGRHCIAMQMAGDAAELGNPANKSGTAET